MAEVLSDEDVELNCELALFGLLCGYRLELCSDDICAKVNSEGGSWNFAWFKRTDPPHVLVGKVGALARGCLAYDQKRRSL